MEDNNITWTDPDIERVIFNFLLARCGLSVLIVLGSCLTLIALCSYKRLRSSPNCVVLSLTIADLLGALLNPALIGLYYLQGHSLWRPLCLAEETIDLIASGGVVISVSLVALDRFLHVVKYISYQQIVTRNRLTAVMVSAWLFVGALATAIIYFGEELQDGKCSWMLFTSRTVYYYVIIPQIGVFFVITVALYARIGHFVFKQRREMMYHRKTSGQSPSSVWSNSRTNTMISIVICSHLLAVFPALILSAFDTNDSSMPMVVVQQSAILVWYAVAAVNPIIYLWRNPDFKWAFRRLLCLSDNKDIADTDISSTKMTAANLTSSYQRH